MLLHGMFWGFITLAIEPQYFAALTDVMSLLTKVEETLDPATEASDTMLLVAPKSMTDIMFL